LTVGFVLGVASPVQVMLATSEPMPAAAHLVRTVTPTD
jgi:hypothetical protein